MSWSRKFSQISRQNSQYTVYYRSFLIKYFPTTQRYTAFRCKGVQSYHFATRWYTLLHSAARLSGFASSHFRLLESICIKRVFPVTWTRSCEANFNVGKRRTSLPTSSRWSFWRIWTRRYETTKKRYSDNSGRNRIEAKSDELPKYRLYKIFGSDVGRDFVLISGDGDERHVHKAVLNASSPVFERMFQSNLDECRTGRCVISDIFPVTLDSLLSFIYHCCVDELAKNAKQILPAADKYEILDLKKACEEALKSTISLVNMADLLSLADMNFAAELKEAVLVFMEAENGKTNVVNGIINKAVKSGRTSFVRELFSTMFKSSRKL